MLRKIVAIVVGAFVAIALIATVEYFGHQAYPPATGIDITDEAAMKQYAATLPVGTLLYVGAAWLIGAFGGGLLAALIAQKEAKTNCMIVGGLVLAGTIMTLISIPHPLWFSFSSVIAVVATILVTAKIAASLVADDPVEQKRV